MSLEIVLGPMFSGKSTYALSWIRRHRAIGKNVLVIKPNIDTRYSTDDLLITHNQEKTPCIMWKTDEKITPTSEMQNADCIVFEESQFFLGLASFVSWFIRAYKKDILIVGLDGDARQEMFGDVLRCVPWANQVTKLCALCSMCRDGTIAPYTKRTNSLNTQQVMVGGPDTYEAVCLKHL